MLNGNAAPFEPPTDLETLTINFRSMMVKGKNEPVDDSSTKEETPEPLLFVVGFDGPDFPRPPWTDCRIVEKWRLPFKKLYGPATSLTVS
jgi:hypothetical protein